MSLKLLRMGLGTLRGLLAETLYLRFGIDLTRPSQFYALVTNRCNARCRMCDFWRQRTAVELPAAVWNEALRSLKDFVGPFHVNFSGGEPLLKEDFFDILAFCRGAGIAAGFTTNGMGLDERCIDRIIELDVFNVNVSLDSTDGAVHDDLRGVPGLTQRVKAGIEALVDRKRQAGCGVRVILKTIVLDRNLDELDRIVRYARDAGCTGVNFQPIFKWSEQSEQMLRVDPAHLAAAVDRLVEMRRSGMGVLNSESSMRLWAHHFTGQGPPRRGHCVIPLRNLTIASGGDVYLCGQCESIIGNVRDGGIREMWKAERARRLRKRLVHCKRACTATCTVNRTLRDYLRLFRQLVRR